MTTKILEAFFRHKLLILLPPLLIPLLVGPIALLQAPVYYEAWTGIWVDRPQYLAYSQAGWNAYATPAQNQANALGAQLIPLLGADSCMWASDYPHTDSTFPHSMKVIEETLGPLPAADRRKLTATNCARLYGFADGS